MNDLSEVERQDLIRSEVIDASIIGKREKRSKARKACQKRKDKAR